MAKDYPRSYRVADQIQRELSELIRFEVKDPRVPESVTIAGVDVNRDLSHGKVFVTMLEIENDAEAKADAIRGLNKAAGFLRKQLSRKMRLRSVPALHFHYDEVQESANKLSALIDDAVATNTTLDETLALPDNALSDNALTENEVTPGKTAVVQQLTAAEQQPQEKQ